MSLITEILQFGIARAAVIDPSKIEYSEVFRRLCEQDKCGHYGKNWMCPPAVGPYADLKAKASGYKEGIVFQTVHRLSYQRDRGGLRKVFRAHDNALKKLTGYLRTGYGLKEMLSLGAGPCTYCERCAREDGKACMFPEHAVASLESYGIDVGALMKLCGMPYKFEEENVTLVGAVFYTPPLCNTGNAARQILGPPVK